MTRFSYSPPDDFGFLQMLVRYLEAQKRPDLARLLSRARCEFVTSGSFSGRRWDGLWTAFRLTVPVNSLPSFTDKVKSDLLAAAETVLPAAVGYDLMDIDVSPAFDDADLDSVTESRAPTLRVAWEDLTATDFERLVFDLVNTSRGYRNAKWLTRTNAPDDGRDLAVERVHEDALAGTIVSRVIIACRHWRTRSTGPAELVLLREQMKLWSPPRVDVLVIATSGHFTTPAVRLVETQNQSDSALRIEPWPSSHLEGLLARREDIVNAHNLLRSYSMRVVVDPSGALAATASSDTDDDIPF